MLKEKRISYILKYTFYPLSALPNRDALRFFYYYNLSIENIF